MNKVYALVWNQALGCWNVTPEGARRRGKSSAKRIAVAAVALLGLGGLAPAFALPVGGTVVSGTADILSYNNGSKMSVNQHTDKLITNWSDFSIGAGQAVTFNQPNATSVALNRVIGSNVSSIKGQLDANGRVFLVNPNGVVIGQRAQVNVGTLVATTRAISDVDFLAGKYHFAGTSSAEIINSGTLTADQGGNIALLGSQVRNDGTIQAQMGRVALGAGSDFTVNFDGNNLLNLQVDAAAVNALALNRGLLKADGGQVLMTASGAGTLLQAVVNNQGAIEAKTLRAKAGRITLDGGAAGDVRVGGALTASAMTSYGNGGVVEVKGANVNTQLGTQVSTQARNGQTGTWRISSGKVSVGATAASIGGTAFSDTLSRNLENTNIELASSAGDLSLNGPVSWKGNNGLTLEASGDVNLNGELTATGNGARIAVNAARDANLNAKVTLSGLYTDMSLDFGGRSNFGKDGTVKLSGTGAAYQSNGATYNVIQNARQLQDINSDLGGLHVLGNDISGVKYSCWYYWCTTSYTALSSIGGNNPFNGSFDGLGNTSANSR
ncbi:filamentous hemagglutinin [Pseudomonas orientalis]|nr:filamentous hemagglutinin [Pseudomonas orientalis]